MNSCGLHESYVLTMLITTAMKSDADGGQGTKHDAQGQLYTEYGSCRRRTAEPQLSLPIYSQKQGRRRKQKTVVKHKSVSTNLLGPRRATAASCKEEMRSCDEDGEPNPEFIISPGTMKGVQERNTQNPRRRREKSRITEFNISAINEIN